MEHTYQYVWIIPFIPLPVLVLIGVIPQNFGKI